MKTHSVRKRFLGKWYSLVHMFDRLYYYRLDNEFFLTSKAGIVFWIPVCYGDPVQRGGACGQALDVKWGCACIRVKRRTFTLNSVVFRTGDFRSSQRWQTTGVYAQRKLKNQSTANGSTSYLTSANSRLRSFHPTNPSSKAPMSSGFSSGTGRGLS